MALNALTLSVTSGVQGRPFQATINGLTTGRVHVRQNEGSPGFSVVNGQLMSSGLPYKTSTVVLRELEPGVGQGFRDTPIDISATTPAEVRSQAQASVGAGRTLRRYRVDGTRNPDGSYTYVILAQDDQGGTTAVPVGRDTLDFPRIGLIGPSTIAQNNYGASATPWRAGNISSGPLVWALMQDRLADFRTMAKTTTPFYDGDNQAIYGATQDSYAAQIAALNARMAGVPNWVAWYEVGRNDVQNNGATGADLIAWTQRDVALLRAGGTKYILLSNLWKKDTSQGGVWAVGGAARVALDTYNAWLKTYEAANKDIIVVDYLSALTDPASADGNPYPWVARAVGTHYSAIGAQRAALLAVVPALRKITKPHPYPPRPAESLIGALSGSGGTKTNATGTVVDGWDLSQAAATATVVGSTEVINGETFQVAQISAATGTTANGGQLTFSKTANIAVAAGKKVGLRCKVLIPATAIPYGLVIGLGSATGQGDASQARAFAIIPQTGDDPTTVIAAPGAAWAATPKFDGSIPQELWVETSSYVLGATGGSNVAVSIGLLFGPAVAAGDTLTIKVGQIQTFEVG